MTTDTKASSEPSLAVSRSGLADYWYRLRSFSPNARRFLTGVFFFAATFQTIQLLLNLYLKELGFPEGDIGAVQSARTFGMALVGIPAGILVARWRIKYVLLSVPIIYAALLYSLLQFRDIMLIIAFAFLAGMVFSFYRVCSGPFFMRNSSKVERTYLFSASFATFAMGGVIGTLGSGQLAEYLIAQTGDAVIGYTYTFYVAIAFGLLALVPFSMIRPSPPSSEETNRRLSFAQLAERKGFYSKTIFCHSLVGIGAGLTVPFLNLYFRDRFDQGPDNIGIFFALVTGAMIIGTMAGPVVTKHFGLVRTVTLTQLLSLPFLVILAFTDQLWLAVVAFLVRGGLMNAGVPIQTNLGLELSRPNEQALINAVIMVSWTGGWTIASRFGGEIIERYGYTTSLLITAGIYFAAAIIWYLFFSRVEVRKQDGPGWYVQNNVSL